MELALLKALLDKELYEQYGRTHCPDALFTDDGKTLKSVIDKSMDRYQRSLTADEIEATFFADNPTLADGARTNWQALFSTFKRQQPIGADVAKDVIGKLFTQYVGDKVANIGLDLTNGKQTNLNGLRNLLSEYGDDFLPSVTVDDENLSVDALIEANALETQWKFNIPTLGRRIEGVSGGHLVFVAARSNTGKTSFQCSMIAGPNGFAEQGAKCIVLCNEESTHRIGLRMLTAAIGKTANYIKDNIEETKKLFEPFKENIMIVDCTGKNMAWVERVCKSYNPDIVVLDMGDKFASKEGYAREDQALKDNAIYARQIAKQYECAVFYMSQLSAEAEGKIVLNQSMLEGSRTGKASEADLMLLIARNPPMEGQEEEDPQRHITIAKNKLSGWHGVIHCELSGQTGRYYA